MVAVNTPEGRMEEVDPPINGRRGVGANFVRDVSANGTPGKWYRTTSAVHRSAVTPRVRELAAKYGVELEVHLTEDGTYRLYGCKVRRP